MDEFVLTLLKAIVVTAVTVTVAEVVKEIAAEIKKKRRHSRKR